MRRDCASLSKLTHGESCWTPPTFEMEVKLKCKRWLGMRRSTKAMRVAKYPVADELTWDRRVGGLARAPEMGRSWLR